MRRRGIIASEIFMYILLLLVVALILFFGYRAVGYFLVKSDEVAKYQFIETLSNKMRETFSFGSVSEEKAAVPTDVDEICFIDWRHAPLIDPSIYPAIYQDWDYSYRRQTPMRNVFLHKAPKESEGFFIGDLEGKKAYFSIDENPYYKCIKALNGFISIRMEGKGDHVEIAS